MEKLLLLDSNSLLHRAYYALPGLTDSKGNPTGAIFGFVSMLARLIKEEKPTHIAAAFDLKAPTFRHNMYAGYKATRKPMPEELVKQVPVLKKLIGDLGIKIVELEGYEADDIIGTLAKRFSCPTDIVTGDRDSLQLIDDTTNVLFTKRGITDVVRYDKERLFEDGFETPFLVESHDVGDSGDYRLQGSSRRYVRQYPRDSGHRRKDRDGTSQNLRHNGKRPLSRRRNQRETR